MSTKRPTLSAKEKQADQAPTLARWLDLLAPELGRSVEREYRFHPVRRWRFDLAWPGQRVAVEVDGGQFVARGGWHNSDADREKMNAAAIAGWRVLRISTQQLKKDPAGAVELIKQALAFSPAPARPGPASTDQAGQLAQV